MSRVYENIIECKKCEDIFMYYDSEILKMPLKCKCGGLGLDHRYRSGRLATWLRSDVK